MASRLIEEGLLTQRRSRSHAGRFPCPAEEEFAAGNSYRPNRADWLDGKWSGIGHADEGARRGVTGVDVETLKEVGRKITHFPKTSRRTRPSPASWPRAAR